PGPPPPRGHARGGTRHRRYPGGLRRLRAARRRQRRRPGPGAGANPLRRRYRARARRRCRARQPAVAPDPARVVKADALQPRPTGGRATAVVAALVLVVAGGVLMLIQWRDIRRGSLGEAQAQARIVAASSAAAVLFGDADGARETLAPLAASPIVHRAEILDASGSVLARHPGPIDGAPALARPCGAGCTWVSAPVTFRGHEVGQVRLQASMARAHARLWGLGIAICIASLVACGLAWPVMRRMRQRVHGAEARLRYFAH